MEPKRGDEDDREKWNIIQRIRSAIDGKCVFFTNDLNEWTGDTHASHYQNQWYIWLIWMRDKINYLNKVFINIFVCDNQGPTRLHAFNYEFDVLFYFGHLLIFDVIISIVVFTFGIWFFVSNIIGTTTGARFELCAVYM